MSFPLPRLTRWTWSSDTTTDLEACRDPAEDLDDGPFQPTVLRTTIENHRAGYPQYSALLSCADNFLVFRRFKRMRSRILLLKQDKLTALEKRLDEIDKAEENPLFLGVSRVDGNKERQDTLFKIEEGLADFGT